MIHRRKIHNVGPMQEPPKPEAPDYLSPHCQNGACSWCKERTRRKKEAATRALQALADANPGMFDPWNQKLGGHQEQLGPSAPGHWLSTYVKETPGGAGDVLGYWPRR